MWAKHVTPTIPQPLFRMGEALRLFGQDQQVGLSTFLATLWVQKGSSFAMKHTNGKVAWILGTVAAAQARRAVPKKSPRSSWRPCRLDLYQELADRVVRGPHALAVGRRHVLAALARVRVPASCLAFQQEQVEEPSAVAVTPALSSGTYVSGDALRRSLQLTFGPVKYCTQISSTSTERSRLALDGNAVPLVSHLLMGELDAITFQVHVVKPSFPPTKSKRPHSER